MFSVKKAEITEEDGWYIVRLRFEKENGEFCWLDGEGPYEDLKEAKEDLRFWGSPLISYYVQKEKE